MGGEAVALGQIVGDSATDPPVDRHIALLGDPRFSHPANAIQRARILSQIQQIYGNAYVQRVVGQMGNPTQPNRIKRDQSAVKEKVEHDGELIGEIAANKGAGKPLDPKTLTEAEASFGDTMGQVRIHDDARANQLAATLQTRAFTTGKDIFFAQGVYRPHTDGGAEILGHELTHMSDGRTRDNIGFWGGKVHRALTEIGGNESGIKGTKLLKLLKDYCTTMDMRARRLMKAVPGAIPHYHVKYRKKYGMWPKGMAIPRITGEGPEHGEGLNYKVKGEDPNKDLNEALQNKYVLKALQAKRAYLNIWYALGRRPGALFKRVLWTMTKDMAKSLGDALHIAQDRGSHWEGEKGKGHGNPDALVNPDFDTDDPGKNFDGFTKALGHTREVFKAFAAREIRRPEIELREKELKGKTKEIEKRVKSRGHEVPKVRRTPESAVDSTRDSEKDKNEELVIQATRDEQARDKDYITDTENEDFQ